MKVYLEVGKKRIFAGGLDWPGWCRSGSSETAALEALLACAPAYGKILGVAGLPFRPPEGVTGLAIIERIPGNATTDFGAPGLPPAADLEARCDAATLHRFESILRAGWTAFDAALRAAQGKPLRLGPRGGGRDLAGIRAHVTEAEGVYLAAAGGKRPAVKDPPEARLAAFHEALLQAMGDSAAGGIPEISPRGTPRWTARYLVRRAAWHVIAHVWEIERRVVDEG